MSDKDPVEAQPAASSAGPPTLTAEIAELILDWASSSCYRMAATVDHGERRMLPIAEHAARDYILHHCREREIFLTDRGIVVEELAARRLEAAAKAFLDQKQKPPVPVIEDFGALKKELDKEPPAPVQIPPDDGVLWALCDGVQAAVRRKEKDIAERVLALKHLAERPVRWLPQVSPEHIAGVRELVRHYPNFEPAIRHIARHLCLLQLGRSALYLPPLLLAGPPGIGKTRFAAGLARILSMQLRVQSMADATANWILTGNSRSWSNGTPGVLARFVAECPSGKVPLLLLDELDKSAGEYRYPVDTALLALLEPETARAFRDENLDLPLDLSPVCYLLTANRLDRIRPEILSRVTVLQIAAPTAEQMPAIVRSVDGAIREEYPLLDRAFELLGEETVAACTVHPPRELRRMLLEAYARVAEREAGRTDGLEVRPQDVETGVQEVALRGPAPRVIQLGLQGPWRMH